MVPPGQHFPWLARAWIRAILFLYLRQFRQRFGAGMLEAFGDRLEEHAALGVWPLAILLTRTTIDLVVAALREWVRPSVPRDLHSQVDDRTSRKGHPMDHVRLDLAPARRAIRVNPTEVLRSE